MKSIEKKTISDEHVYIECEIEKALSTNNSIFTNETKKKVSIDLSTTKNQSIFINVNNLNEDLYYTTAATIHNQQPSTTRTADSLPFCIITCSSSSSTCSSSSSSSSSGVDQEDISFGSWQLDKSILEFKQSYYYINNNPHICNNANSLMQC